MASLRFSSGFLALLALFFVRSPVWGHVTFVCSSTDPSRPGKAWLFVGTYHKNPALSNRTTRGIITILTPSGVEIRTELGGWCLSGPVVPWATVDRISKQLREFAGDHACRNVIFDGSKVLSKNSSISCFMPHPNPPDSRDWASVARGDEQPYCLDFDGISGTAAGDKHYFKNTKTWYFSEFTANVPGTFRISIERASMHLRSGGQPPCSLDTGSMRWPHGSHGPNLGYGAPVHVDMSIADGGNKCMNEPLLPNTGHVLLTSLNTCRSGAFSGYVCPLTCKGHHRPVGLVRCRDGTWIDDFTCERRTCALPGLETTRNGRRNNEAIDQSVTAVSGKNCGEFTRVYELCNYTCGQLGLAGIGHVQCLKNGSWVQSSDYKGCPTISPHSSPLISTISPMTFAPTITPTTRFDQASAAPTLAVPVQILPTLSPTTFAPTLPSEAPTSLQSSAQGVESDNKSAISGGAIAGASVASVLAAVAIGFVVVRRRQQQRRGAASDLTVSKSVSQSQIRSDVNTVGTERTTTYPYEPAGPFHGFASGGQPRGRVPFQYTDRDIKISSERDRSLRGHVDSIWGWRV